MKLKLEDIQVDSFPTHETTDEAGTVQGYQFSYPHFSCPPKYTCPECASPVMDEEPAE
jgi:hypothetical protein